MVSIFDDFIDDCKIAFKQKGHEWKDDTRAKLAGAYLYSMDTPDGLRMFRRRPEEAMIYLEKRNEI